jgi:hypothetical protein
MKIQFHSRCKQQGNVLIVTFFIASLSGMFLVYYLNLIRTQSTLVARSQTWNASLTTAEAGVEEALAQLNPGAPAPFIDRAANNWGGPANGVYGPMSRTCGTGFYSVAISNDTPPTIYSTGTVSNTALQGALTRVLCVTTTNTSLFSVAMAAKQNINFTGNGVTTDSFNSSDPNLSENGMYPVDYPLRRSTNGDVASIGGFINVGNANVNGTVYLGPTATESLGSSGYITGGVSNDFNVEFEDVILPQTTWTAVVPLAVPLNIGGISYKYVFPDSLVPTTTQYYSMDGSGLNNQSLYVGTNTHVTLLVTSSASPTDIHVAGSGTNAGQLTLYMDGQNFSLSGTNIVDSGNALSFTYYGTTNNTQISLKGNATFTGTIYAPEADFKLNGGGNSIYDFVGSSVTKSVTMTGHFNFHFDENLLKAGPMRGYVATSWREL